MKNDPKVQIFDKIVRVILSCETEDQLTIANRYLKIAEQNGFIPMELGVAIYYNVYLDKAQEFYGDVAEWNTHMP